MSLRLVEQRGSVLGESLAKTVCLSPLGRAAQLIQQLLALDRGSQQVERSTTALESPVTKGVLGRYLEGWYAMPVDLPPKSSGVGTAPANGVLNQILNWSAVVVCIGLCWWAIEFGLWETMKSLLM